jgi:Uncharacterized conserved protein
MIVVEGLEEAENLLLGASILATGGGGSLRFGLEILRGVLESGKRIRVLDLREFSESEGGVLVSPYFIGSMGSLGERREEKIRDMLLKALNVMERELGRKVVGFVSSELGGSNTAVPLYASALADLPVVDGDLMGRAGPELHQSTAHILGLKVTPSVVVSPRDSIVLLKDVASVDDYESIARHVAYISGGWSLVVDTPLTLRDAEKAVIKGTLSFSAKLGRIVREAMSKRLDVVGELVKALDGWRVFDGIASTVSLTDTGKFLEGFVEVQGTRGKLKVYVKNEYLLALLDGKPVVMCPDLIILLDESGYPVLSNMVREGMRVIVIAARAPSIWRSVRGLELFGPRHFGFNFEYKPVEELLGMGG